MNFTQLLKQPLQFFKRRRELNWLSIDLINSIDTHGLKKIEAVLTDAISKGYSPAEVINFQQAPHNAPRHRPLVFVRNVEQLKFLISMGADLDYWDKKNEHIFYHLASQPECIEYLLSLDHHKHLQLKYPQILPDILSSLIPTFRNDMGGPISNFDSVKWLLEKEPQLLEAASFKGETLLVKAANAGHLEIVQLLVDKGADIHKEIKMTIANKETWGKKQVKETALTAAIYHDKEEVVDFLLKQAKTVNDIQKFEASLIKADLPQSLRQTFQEKMKDMKDTMVLKNELEQTLTQPIAKNKARAKNKI